MLIKKQARVMLTSNIDISDRLINGHLGSMFDFAHSGGNKNLKLDDSKAELKAKGCDRFAIETM